VLLADENKRYGKWFLDYITTLFQMHRLNGFNLIGKTVLNPE